MVESKAFESGKALEAALKGGELSSDQYVGMVKESAKEGFVAFAPGSCEKGWIDIPVGVIHDVEVLRHVPCREHTHPLVRMSLKLDASDPMHVMVGQLMSVAGSSQGQGSMSFPLAADSAPATAMSRMPFPSPQTYGMSPLEESGMGMGMGSMSFPLAAARRARPGGLGLHPLGIVECKIRCCSDCCEMCSFGVCIDGLPCCWPECEITI